MLIRFIYTFLIFNIIFIQSSSALDADIQPVVFEDSAEEIPAESIFYYYVKLKNNTSTSTTNSDVNLTVTIPVGFDYNATNLTECSYGGLIPSEGNETRDVVFCNFTSFSGNQARDINITLKSGREKGVFKSIATAFYDGDVNNDNDSENVKTTIVESADVELVSYDAVNPIIPSSGIVEYKMVVKNHGPFATNNIKFGTRLATGLEFYGDNADTPSDDDSNWNCSSSGQDVTCTRDSLDIDDIKTFYFRAKSVNDILGDLGQDGEVESDSIIIDTNLNNNINHVNIEIVDGTNVAINKKIEPELILENDVARFELEVSNIGYREAENVVVTDTIDSNFPIFDENITAPADWNCTISSQTLTCTYDKNMTKDYSGTIKIAIQAPDITDDTDDYYSNSASVTTTSADTDSLDDDSTINFIVWADQADVNIYKKKTIKVEPKDGNPIVEGEMMVSKIIVYNNGPREAIPVQIFDDLDENETYSSFTGTDWNCSVSGKRVTCDYNRTILTNENSKELIIETKADSDGDIENIALINNSKLLYPDLDTINHAKSQSIKAKAYPESADLVVVKDTNDTDVTSDENRFEYYIDITNNGPAVATNINFRDVIPQYIEAFGDRLATHIVAETNSTEDNHCSVNNAEVNCSISSIDVNDTVRVTIGVFGAKAVGTKENNATAFSSDVPDPNRTNNEGNVTVTVESSADIMVSVNKVTFASEDEFIYAGTNGLYTIQVINNGPIEAKDVNLTNVFIGDKFKVIEFNESDCTLADDNRSFSCDLGDMNYKESKTIEITIRPTHYIGHNIPWDINNTATVTMSTFDSNLSNNEKNETLPIKDGEVDISIEKDESELFIEPLGFDANDTDNNRIVYKITVTNLGLSEATGIKLVDKMVNVFPNNDQNVTFLGDGTDANGTTVKDFNMCVEPTNNNFNPNNTESSHEVNCSIPNMESGDEFIRYLTFQLHDSPHRVKGDVYHNEINVTTLEVEKENDNNFEDEKSTVRTFVDLEINKTASIDNVEVGQDFNFTFDIYNNGPGYATSTEVTDTLPNGMELIATPIVRDNDGTCSGGLGDIKFACNIGNLLDDGYLALEDNKSIQIIAQVRVVNYPSSGQVINTTLVITSAPDKNLTNNKDNSTVGVYKPAVIGNKVWLDKNANGIQDSGEIGLKGVLVKLLDENKTLVTTTTTNSSGIYNFDINHTADYFILVEPDSKYQISPKNVGGNDELDSDINSSKITDKFHVDYGDNNQSFDIGLYEFASLGDRVWLDNNGDGIQDSGELNVSDVNVTLYIKGNLTAIAQMETNETGEYLFENLVPNKYFVKFSDINVSYRFTVKDTGDDINGSDVNTTGYTDIFELKSNEHNRSIDAGIFEPVSVGNLAWHDKNADGIQDNNESNLSNVKIELWTYGDWQQQVKKDLDGNTFGTDGTIETNSTGEYIFDNLKPDKYYLKVTELDGYKFTFTHQGSDYKIDSNIQSLGSYIGDSTSFILYSGEDNKSIDIGLYKPVKIGGNVWEDYDYNGTRESSEDNVSNVTVTLITDGTITTTTTVTDSNGSYIFDDLLPNHTYGVEFSNLPANYLFTKQDIGSDDNDSDANITGYTIQTDIMYSGDSNLTLDAGIYDPIVIGDRVWEDSNYNGIQDSGENGVAGVLVKLVIDNIVQDDINTTTNSNGNYYFGRVLELKPDHNYSVEFVIPNGWFATKQNIGDDGKDSDGNANGQGVESVKMYSHQANYRFDMGIYRKASLGDRVWIDKNGNGLQDSGEDNVTEDINVTLYSSDGTEINSTSTGADGTYLFSGLNPDSYFVIFDKSTLPTDYVITEVNISNNSNDLLDSDANRTTGQSDTLFLSSGEDNRSVDMGIYKPVDIGDKIWIDTDADGIQDSNENNYTSAITITLVDINGLEANRTVDSNSSGYLFKDVRPGSYYLDFNVPSQYEISPKNATSSESDSNVNSNKQTDNFDIVSSEDDLTIDLGIYQNISLGDRIWYDTNMNGIQDSGENNLSVSVTVELYKEDGTLVDTNVTTNGEYLFTDFTPSNYYLKFTLPNNYAISPDNAIGSDDNNDSDINSTMQTDIITMGSNDENLSIDVGMYELASIGDRIWLDKNANGIQDIGEDNITEDITVTLYYDNNGTVARSVTTNDGSYHFSKLIPTDYNLSFTVPNGYYITNQDVGVDSNDSDVNITTLRTVTTNLETGENDLTWDMGIYQKASLGNRVWIDANGNGLQDSGESNVSDINVTLYKVGNPTPLESVDTNATGGYLFTELIPSEYYVVFDNTTLPTDYIFTEQNITGSSDLLDSDANTSTGISDIIELSSNEHNRSIDAGIYKPVNLGNRIWEDTNADGIQDTGELNTTQSITVTLYDTNHREANRTTTISNGDYLFTNVRPGNYQVEFSLPSGYKISYENSGSDDLIDSDVNPTTKITQSFDLVSNQNDLSRDMGIYQEASLGDRVWIDANGNGVQDNNELNVSNVTVKLHLVSDDSEVDSKTTNGDGEYLFTNVRPQNYYVVFSGLDTNYIFTLPNNDSNNSIDSDVDENGKSEEIRLSSNEHNRTIDAGIVLPITIGDRIWKDTNANGIQDLGEGNYTGNLEVKLYYENNDSIYKTTTATNGEYEFTNVIPENYYIGFEIPSTYYTSPKNATVDTADSDTNTTGFTAPFAIHSGDNNLTLDMGIYQKASLGNRVWIDNNGNGLQDSGELNVTDVNVTLYDSLGNELSSMNTVDGAYLFDELVPSEYYVVFDKTTLPQDYIFTEQNITGSSDLLDSDANTSTGISDIIELSSNEHNRSIDAGIYKPVNLGDRIWEDTNANGIQDANERNTTQNITVTLYDTNHREANRTITALNGDYLFTNVRPGNYQVEFSLPNGYKISYETTGSNDLIDSDVNSTTKITQAFELKSNVDDLSRDMGIYQEASLGDRVWIDANGNGIQDNDELNVTGVTVKLHLVSDNSEVYSTTTNADGEYLFEHIRPQNYYIVFSNLDTDYIFTLQDNDSNNSIDSDVDENGKSEEIRLSSNEHNRTIDAGIVLPITIGDRIWEDTNANGIQDLGEGNYTGNLEVKLYYENNDSIYKTTTATNGEYEFTNVIPENYYIGFEIPSTYYTSPKNATVDTADSDTNTTGFTAPFAIHSGDNNLTLDMGIYQKASLGNRVWIDNNGNGLQDSGELNVTDVNVTLYKVGNPTPLESVDTNATGGYLFTELIPSEYYVVFDNTTLPTDYIFTEQNITGSSDLEDSDANTTTGISDTVELSSNEHNRSIDAGIYKPVNLGDRIWEDTNADGIQDANERNTTQNITVTLYDTNHREANRTITALNGDYLFTNVRPGNYQVEFSLPNGYKISYETTGSNDLIDSDVNSTTKITQAFELKSNVDDLSRDMGIYQEASLGDRVWIDANGNGIQDNDELNVTGVTVKLHLVSDNSEVYSTTTNADGEYLFEHIRPQNYYIVFSNLDTDYIFTLQDNDSNNSIDSDVDENGKSEEIRLSSNEHNRTIDAGIVLPITIGDRIWEDTNANGIQDLGEGNYTGNLEVKLYYENNDSIYKTTTATNGEYEFTNVIPENYYIGFEIPSTYYTSPKNIGNNINNDSDTNSTGFTDGFAVHSGDNNLTLDMGIYQKASLGNRVWIDNNGNGLQDSGELNVTDVNVTLYSTTYLDVNITQETNSSGYLFKDLKPGEYYVVLDNRTFPTPIYIFTEQDRLNDDTIDSDVNATTGISDTLILRSGDNNLTLDVGIYEPVVKVGDRIWEDTNANGIQDIGEGNYIDGNITITLVDNNGLEPNATIITNDGNYTFTKVRPGNYHLEFTLPTNYHISFKDNADDNSDSDIDPITKKSPNFDIVSGINDLSWDMGIYQNASLGDRIWIDNDGDGLQGIGELNITESIDVTLYYEDNESVAQSVTSSNGEYQFNNLIPEKYYIMFSDLNTSYRFTVKDSGDDINDSDVNATGYSNAFELRSNEHNRSVDAGILLPVSIGDRIWIDTNANGIQDTSEINTNEEINVTLYYDANKSIARTLTTTNGEYLFNNLNPERYYIKFDLPTDYYVSPKARATDNNNSDVNSDGFTDSFAVYSGDENLSIDMGIYEKASIGDEIWYDMNMDGIRDATESSVNVPVLVKLFDANGTQVATQNSVNGVYRFTDLIPSGYIVEFELPNNYALSPMNVGGDDTTDSDVNVTTMRSDVIKISDSGDVDLSIDMGVYELASIGDRIWLDANANGVQDSDESNYIGSISVALYNASGSLISRKNITNGVYLFDELEPDDYYIQFSLPSGYILSDNDATGDSADSDVGVSNLRTISTNLAPAENDMSWDMGIYQPVSIGDRIWLDANANGVQDNDEQNYDGEITIELYKQGVKVRDITVDDGEYLFSGLRPSEYSVKVILPDGYYLSPKGVGDDNSSDSDMGLESFESDSMVLSSGVNIDNLDIGIYQFASIGDRIWYDTNMDGIQDVNESNIDVNISVRLYNSNNEMIREVYSDDGVYLFSDLIPDDYSVEFDLIDGYIVTKANRGSDDDIDSDVGANMRSGEMMLRSGEDNRSVDMGVYESVSIGDRIWLDDNGNGLQDDNELSFDDDVVVQLYSSDDNLVREISVSDGVYLFEELEPDEYYIKVELPDGYVITKQNVGNEDNQTINSDINASSMSSDMILLRPSDANMSVDIGVYQLASIGDEIWLDENANGVQDDGESGACVEIEVVLYDINGSEVDRLVTTSGDYIFNDIEPSSYYIKFIVDDGYLFSNIGNDGVSDVIVILSGEKNEVTDVGIYLINNELIENSIDALDDEVSTLENRNISIPVMSNDYDLNGDEFEIIRFDENSSGGGVISKDGDNLVYVPKDGFIGLDMFRYEIMDSNGLISKATVRVNVLELSSLPIAFNDKFITDMDVSLEVDILGNDIHTMDENISLLSVENSASGSVEILGNGLVKYIPNSGFSGVDRFTYVIIDGDGDESKAVVTVIVSKPIVEEPIIKQPIIIPAIEISSVPIANTDKVDTNEFTSVIIDLLSNDTHTTGDDISLLYIDKPANGIVILKDDGSVIYIPNFGFSGVDRFSYTVEDSDGDRDTGLIIVTVIPDEPITEEITPKLETPKVNEPKVVIETPIENNITESDKNETIDITPVIPVVPASPVDDECGEFIINDDVFEGVRDEVAYIDVFENDILVGSEFDYDSLSFIDNHGELVSIIEIDNEGVWSIDNEKGLIIFTPIEGFKGMATEIKYISNALNGCKPIIGGATIYVSYPEVKDDVIELPEDAIAGKDPVTVDIFANDPIKDPILSTLQIKGTTNAGDPLVVKGEGTWVIHRDKIIFTPFDGFLGDPTPIEYIVQNNEGESTNYGKVKIFYPVKARDNTAYTDPGVPVTIDILGDDNGNLEKSSVILIIPEGFPVPDTTISTDGKTITVPNEGIWQVNEDGTVTFTPDPLLVGSPTSIEYSVFNKDGDKVAGAKITVECEGCICEGQIDSADSASGLSIILLVLLTLLLVSFVSKRKEI